MASQVVNEKSIGFYDFFAGGGMAHFGLGPQWRCLLANDFSAKKAQAYQANHPLANEFILEDVAKLTQDNLPNGAELAWASFPCQDLSLAGNGRGLEGERSGSFWGFWRLMEERVQSGEALPLIVLENVVGTISARKGADFQTIIETLASAGYRVGPLVINAVHFLPQSRPRLFIVAVRENIEIPAHMLLAEPDDLWHPTALRRAHTQLPAKLQATWLWWHLPKPSKRQYDLIDLIEDEPTGVKWHTPAETQRLLDLMAPNHLQKVQEAQTANKMVVGTIYKRVRRDKQGNRAQRAEIRFDGVSGCLRTASGGSSRQIVMIVEGEQICSRLLSPREGARLMGLPESYQLPEKYNDAYHLLGDGLAVPVIAWLDQHILTPLFIDKAGASNSSTTEQFLAANLHELSGFHASRRRTTIDDLLLHYNAIIDQCETDPSLKIRIGK